MPLSAHSSNLQRWGQVLNKNSDWRAALENAFDAIGFTEAYVDEAAEKKLHHRRKALKDNVWGMVEIEPSIAWLMDSPLLQRLRYVKQLGLTYLTYPGAQHSRFEHSIGVYHVVNRLLTAIRLNGGSHDGQVQATPIEPACYLEDDYNSKLVKLAAVLHDSGHIPFSHACEQFFESDRKETSIGPFTIDEFLNDFQAAYRGVADGVRIIETREDKSLSEIVSVAIVLSQRFRRFLEVSCPIAFSKSAEEVTCDLAALILGDPIHESDRALPQLISGTFDADKVDYMLRDSHECGLEIGIDVSRLFFRASVYKVNDASALTENVPKHIRSSRLPVKLFLLDQSGTDAALEMAIARLSLYTRVYFHQLTLNAQSQLIALMREARKSSESGREWSDFLSVWTHSDQSILYCLRNDKAPSVSRLAKDLVNRKLLKRASCFSIELFASSAAGRFPSKALEDRVDKLHQQAYATLLSNLREPQFHDQLLAEIRELCSQFAAELKQSGREGVPSGAPDDLRFILPPVRDKALLPQSLVITPSAEISLQRARDASYVDAGRIAAQRAYLLAPPEWRELALLAFQLAVYKRPELLISRTRSEAEGKIEAYRTMFRPVLMLDASASQSRIDARKVRDQQRGLLKFYRASEVLIQPPTELINELVSNSQGLFGFEGEREWSLDRSKVAAFITQFPHDLRDHARKLIQSIRVLDRPTTVALVRKALQAYVAAAKPIRAALVPLTPSSGERLRSVIKDELSDLTGLSVVSTVHDALASEEYDQIVFIDDNIASGTQCLDQLRYWLEFPTKERDSNANYFRKKLSQDELARLQKTPIAFAFAVGNDTEKQQIESKIVELVKQRGVTCVAPVLSYGENLSQFSGRPGSGREIDENLREFLRLVGGQVIRPHIEEGGAIDAAELDRQCKDRALGYRNAEGLLATLLSVPSSTYTALWCPGTYIRDDVEIPWLPLMIRDGHEKYTVLF